MFEKNSPILKPTEIFNINFVGANCSHNCEPLINLKCAKNVLKIALLQLNWAELFLDKI
jgi:hypothetical protein